MKNRKGAASQLTWVLVTMVIAVVAGILITAGGGKAFAKSFSAVDTRFDDLGDCDLDHVANLFDQCPCTSTQGNSDLKFRGCPVGTQQSSATADKNTCGWYLTNYPDCNMLRNNVFSAGGNKLYASEAEIPCYEQDDKDINIKAAYVPNCEGPFKDVCKKFEDSNQRRCDYISSLVTEVAEGAGKGIKGDWDLQATLSVYRDNEFNNLKKEVTPGESYTYTADLAQVQQNEKFGVKVNLKRIGKDNLPKPFQVSFEICDTNQVNCKPLIVYADWELTTTGSLEFLSSTSEENGKVTFWDGSNPSTFITQGAFLNLGVHGDYCDGEGITTCYVKVIVDSANEYNENDENNNQFGFFVTLTNQYSLQAFSSFRVIDLRKDWDSTDAFTETITRTCPEDKTVSECGQLFMEEDDPGDNNPNAGSYPTTDAPNEACWIFASELDSGIGGGDPDRGAAAFAEGKIISRSISNDFSSTTDWIAPQLSEDDAQGLFINGKWNYPAGDLLCTANIWRQCDEKQKGKKIVLQGNEYTCQDSSWVITSRQDVSKTTEESQLAKLSVITLKNDDDCSEGDKMLSPIPKLSSIDTCLVPKTLEQCRNEWLTENAPQSGFDGSWPISEVQDGGCWVFLKEQDDIDGSDLGAISVPQYTVMPAYEAQALDLSIYANRFVTTPGGEEAKCLITHSGYWYSTLGLICKANKWEICSPPAEGLIIDAGTAKYTCKDYAWVK